MKKRRLFCLVLALCFVMPATHNAVYATVNSAIPETTTPTSTGSLSSGILDQSVVSGSHTADAQRPILGDDKLLKTAGAAMLYEVNSDTTMYAWNPDAAMYPASLVKIMTALLALENGDVSATVTVSANAMAALDENSATLKLQVGEELTLEQLLYCLLVGGANDAAVVIADHIAGSQMGFVQMMNERATALGCEGTVFFNPHGLHEEGQVTTARDMVKILREAMKFEEFAAYFAATAYTLPATNLSEERYMETTNFMMTPDTIAYYDKRVTGGRTGVTTDRERCLIVSAEQGNITYIAVVLGAVPTFEADGYTPKYFGSYEETRELLALGFEGLDVVQVLQQGQVLLQYPVSNSSSCVAAGPSKSVATVLPTDIEYSGLSWVYQQNIPSLVAPIKAGEAITSVQLWYGDICVAESPVVSMNSAADIFNVVDDGSDGETGSIVKLLIIVAILVGTAGLCFGVVKFSKFLRISSLRLKYKNRRKDRRRSR